MNVSEMMSMLALRLEDAEKTKFTDAFKLKALNNAQIKLANLLHPAYLSELEVVETALTATSGEYNLSSLQNDVLKSGQGVLKVKINGSYWGTRIPLSEVKKTENTFLAGSTRNPIWYVFGNKIVVSNGETNPSIDVYYLKRPTSLIYDIEVDTVVDAASFTVASDEGLSSENDYYNGAVIYHPDNGTYHVVTDYVGASRAFTISPSMTQEGSLWVAGESFRFVTHDFDQLNLDSVECDLNQSLHELVVGFAEAECWGMANQHERRKSALDSVYDEISALNQSYAPAEGIGTESGRK
jgi:hypothetical protein